MPSIPASGPISMSMFNTVVGRASNTSNSKLAGGSTITTDSLFYLASLSGSINTTAPHAMSEWYGYTAATNVDITICIKYDTTPSNETTTDFGFYYALSTDNGATYSADTLFLNGGNITTTCDCSVLTVPANRYGAFGFRTTNGGKGGYGVNFNGTKLGGTCPAQSLDYCGTYNLGGNPYITSWSTVNASIYFTIYVGKGYFSIC